MTVTVDQPVFSLDLGDRAARDVILADNPNMFWRLGAVNGLVDQSPVPLHNGTAAGGLVVGGIAAPGLLLEQPVGAGLETDGATAFGGGYATSTYSPFSDSVVAVYRGRAQLSSNGAGRSLFGGDGAGSAFPSFTVPGGTLDLRFRIRDNDTGATSQCTWTAAIPSLNTTFEWALMVDPVLDTAELYINGRSQGVKTGLTQTYSTPGNFLLGAIGSIFTATWIGSQDEVAVFTTRLPPERFWSHFQAGQMRYKIPGTAEALVQLTLTDAATKNRDHVEVGVQKGHDPTVVQRQYVTAVDLVTAGMAGAAATRAGAYDPTGASPGATVRATLGGNAAAICRAVLKNVGRHRIRSRVYGSGIGTIYIRAMVQSGDGNFIPASNGWVALQGISNFYDVDLGLAILPAALVGAQQTTIQIEAYSLTPGDTLDINAVGFMPTDRFVRARAPLRLGIPGVASASDLFNQTAGNVTGKSLDVGGTWTAGASSDARDFTVDATGHQLTRSVALDANFYTGRFIYASTPTLAALQAQVDVNCNGSDMAAMMMLLLRYVDYNNWVAIGLSGPLLAVFKRVGGGAAAQIGLSGRVTYLPQTWYTIRAVIDANGAYAVWGRPVGYPLGDPDTSGQDNDFQTGGALATGRVGLYDSNQTGLAVTRQYDNFSVSAPTLSHACNSGQQLQVDHEKAKRLSSGLAGDPPIVDGRAFLKLPPNETHRLSMKLRRSDADTLPDQGLTDAQQLGIVVTPRVLLLP